MSREFFKELKALCDECEVNYLGGCEDASVKFEKDRHRAADIPDDYYTFSYQYWADYSNSSEETDWDPEYNPELHYCRVIRKKHKIR